MRYYSEAISAVTLTANVTVHDEYGKVLTREQADLLPAYSRCVLYH
jgi:hypothetical protein